MEHGASSSRSGGACTKALSLRLIALHVIHSTKARKALYALKGLVKLQALIRGHLVRKQAAKALQHLQVLMTAQSRTRSQRIKMAEEAQMLSQRRPDNRRSPQQPRFPHSYDMEKNAEENIKIVEMDLGQPTSSSKSRNSYYIPPSEFDDYGHSMYSYGSRTPSKADIQLQYSPSPSAFTDISPRACSNHLEEFSFATTQNSPQYFSAISASDSTHGFTDYSSFPRYMANTQSSRAKVRSQSAPRQRLESYERQSSGRRQSVEGRSIPRNVKMQRSSSLAAPADSGYPFPWHFKLDRSSASVRDSECGSTSTAPTNTDYCRSIAAYEVYGK